MKSSQSRKHTSFRSNPSVPVAVFVPKTSKIVSTPVLSG